MDTLPVEVLQIIFKYLSGSEALKCCEVCSHWKNCIEGLEADFWRDACIKDHSDTWTDAHRKSSLSWFHLYESLSLWPNVANANTTSKTLKKTFQSNFYILANNRISVPVRNFDKGNSNLLGRNTLVYYDLATFEECHREDIDIYFIHYIENDNMILFVDNEHNVSIKVKPNMTSYSVGILRKRAIEEKTDLAMLDKEVYFKDTKHYLIICKLIDNDNGKVIETKNFGYIFESLQTVKRIDENTVHIMTIEGYIFSLENDSEEFEELCFLSEHKNNITLLDRCGFKWWCHDELNQLLSYEEIEPVPSVIRKYKSPIVCSFGNILILGTNQHHIHIFEIKRLNCKENEYPDSDNSFIFEKKYSAKKLLSINLNDFIQKERDLFKNKINKIDVVETVKGHNIIVLYECQIAILELSHNEPKKPSAPKKSKNVKKSDKRKTKSHSNSVMIKSKRSKMS